MGGVNDNYFLAAISAISEDEERFEKLFYTQELNDQGIYAMRFFIKGVPVTYIVDDYLPFTLSDDGTNFDLSFAQMSDEGGFWTPILEKAWAKLNGNYEHIFTGHISEAFKTLLGVPTEEFVMTEQSIDDVWAIVSAASANGYIIGADSWGTGDDQQLNDFGILLSHSYVILGAYEATTDDGDTVQLIQLRDPWESTTSYYGPYNNSDEVWTDDLIA